MNRFLVAVMVAGMAAFATGCATGVEDPQPAPPPAQQSNPAPVTPFAADLETDESGPPDPNLIDNGFTAPKPDLEKVSPPVPVNEKIDPYRESDGFKTPEFEAPIPVNG
jgi:hypothetical protein